MQKEPKERIFGSFDREDNLFPPGGHRPIGIERQAWGLEDVLLQRLQIHHEEMSARRAGGLADE